MQDELCLPAVPVERGHGQACGVRGDSMRELEQQTERLRRQPPDRRTDPGEIAQQREPDERHDHERHQRDSDDIGDRPVDTCPVEVE